MAKVVNTEIDSQPIGSLGSLWQITLVGIVLGALFWCLTIATEQYFVNPIFCRTLTNAYTCLYSTSISGDIATILIAVVGIVLLLRLYVARPLLIAVAVGASLWGLTKWTSGLYWGEAIAWSVLLYGVAYTLFSWVARYIKSAPVVLSTIVIVAAIRYILTL